MKLSKIVWVLLVLTITAAIWIPLQRKHLQLRREIARAETRRAEVEQQNTELTGKTESLQKELTSAKTACQRTVVEMAKASSELAKVHPDALWAVPPITVPDWNNESPYVWLRKETIPKLPAAVFTDAGEVQTEVASVLTIAPGEQQTLNAALKRCLAEYQALEVARVEPMDEHLPGIAGESGETLTIRVPPLPEEGGRARQQFEATLREALGDQRANLVTQIADGWLDTQFSHAGTESKTISLILHPGGSIGISIKSGNSLLSTGVDKSRPELIHNYIPRHLAPFFKTILQ
jgi:hypothetical protein